MINLKTKEEIKIMYEAGKKLAFIMNELEKDVKIGITTKYLNEKALKLIDEQNSEPAFLNYHSFPAAICVSVNEVVVHGIPSDYIIKDGDLVKLDIGIKYMGYYVDMAKTIGVGNILEKERQLILGVEEAFFNALKFCFKDNTLGDVGWAIEVVAKKYKFGVVDKLTGHGIGKKLHEDPQVLNYGQRGRGLKIEVGMVLAIEPMFCVGDGRVLKQKDGSWRSADSSKTAHFEHTVAILENGPLILTQQ